MRVDLSKYDNSWYHPGRSVVIRFVWYIINAVFFVSPFFPVSGFKVLLLKLFGARLGRKVVIKPRVNIKYPWNLYVGENTWIGEGVWIDNLVNVKIGANCCLSQGAMLLCGNHNYRKETFDLMVGEITLEDGVWIGANSVVPGNIKCYSHSVLSLQSVASDNLAPYCIYRGNPAQRIRKRILDL
jgi:putative colanic acid biosynthesis acetyltransferase WcaF